MENQGIMALQNAGMQAPTAAPAASVFDPAASAAFEQARKQVNPKEFSQELLSAAEQADPVAVKKLKAALSGIQLPQESIDAMQQMVEIVLRDPQNYAEIRRQMLEDGVPAELLPETFDPIFFGALRVALDQVEAEAGGQPVQSFAAGGIANLRPIAQAMQGMGRNQDTMLAHITPKEARVLQMMGGIGTINPTTGLREYGWFKDLGKAIVGGIASAGKAVGKAVSGAAKAIGNAVKDFASSTVGKIVTTVALGFFLGPAAASFLGVTSAAGVAAVSGFVGSFGAGVLSGQSLKESLKSGAISALTAGTIAGVTGGAGAFESGSYSGPTTISGQYERAVESGKSLLGLSGAPSEVSGTLQYTGTGEVIPGANAPAIPTMPTTTELATAPITPSADSAGYSLANAPGAPGGVGLKADGFIDTNYRPDLAAVNGSVSYEPATGVGGKFLDTGIKFGGSTGLRPATDFALASDLGSTASQGIGGLPAADINYLGQPSAAIPSPIDAQAMLEGGTYSGPIGQATETLRSAYNTVAEPVKNIYNEYFNPSRDVLTQDELFAKAGEIQQKAGTSTQLDIFGRPQQVPNLSFDKALTLAEKSQPGLISQYAPIAGVGLGAAYLGGAFNPQQEAPADNASDLYGSESGVELLAQNPAIYGTTPGGADIQYSQPQYRGYGLQPVQYMRPQIQFNAPQYRGTFADGGIASLAKGGSTNFPRKTGPINGPGTGTSDSIPAMLSDGEFVFTAKAVRAMGKGSRRLGAKRMYALMKALEGKA